MSPKAPISAALSRPPIAATVVIASAAVGMLLCWQLGLAEDSPDTLGLGAITMYAVAFGLAVWVLIHGAGIAWRWIGWLVDRALLESPGRVLHWLVPLTALICLVGAATLVPSAALDPQNPVAAAIAPFVTSMLLLGGIVVSFIYTVRGIARHRDRVKRSRGWLPDIEVAHRNEAAAWQAAWQHAGAAAQQLRQRQLPRTCSPIDVMTRPGEQVFLDAPMEYARYYATDATYVHTSGLYLGSPMFVAAGLAGNAIGNASARARAQRDAALQWREIQPARVLVTSQRLLVHVATGWLTFDHEYVVSFHPEPSYWSLVLEHHGIEPLRLSGRAAPHAAVLLASILRGPELLDSHPAFAPFAAPTVHADAEDRGLTNGA